MVDSITQEEAKEIVAYAAERHITVVPEIDLPGHMLAALGRLSGTWGVPVVRTKFGDNLGCSQMMCFAPATMRPLKFMEDVLGRN